MNKPRLAEILGVEVGERFRVKDSDDAIYCVNEQGYLDYGDNTTGYVNAGILCDIISSPERIIHKSKWTQQDISDARSLKRLFDLPKNTEIYRDDITNLPTVRFKEETGDITTFLHMAEECFPHLKDDVMVSLEEILNAEAEDDE